MRRRVAPFGDPRINGYLLLPEAFRSLSRPSSAPDAKAFPLRSFQLDLLVAKSAWLRFRFRENSARSLAPRFSPKTRFRRTRTGVTVLLRVVREFLVLFENYAGFTKIDEIVVTLHPSGCCSTINFAPFTFPQRDLSVALLAFCHIVQFSRCRSLTSFEVRSKHSASRMLRFDLKFGGDSRVRTGDLLLARQALSQLSYIPDFFSCGGPEWARTTDLTIISRTL